jgi:hypothetical protein
VVRTRWCGLGENWNASARARRVECDAATAATEHVAIEKMEEDAEAVSSSASHDVPVGSASRRRESGINGDTACGTQR